jgi:hypothetical protein
LLGESHYGAEPVADKAGLTRLVIERFALGDKPLPFFSKVAHLVGGAKASSREARAAFWNKVAFYNFVQELAGTGPRQRPTHEMWEAGKPGFAHVLELLRPRCMLILGKQLARSMQEPQCRFAIGVIAGTDVLARTHLLADGSQVVALTISHPSSGRLRYDYWKPRVQMLLGYGRTLTEGSPAEARATND